MAKKISTLQIGDGGFPNKFWVSVSEDYLYLDPENDVWAWLSDVIPFEPKNETIRVFRTYRDAKRYCDDIILGADFEGIVVNCKTIEDRLSGEVYREVKMFEPVQGEIFSNENEDISFTEERDPNFH